MIRGRTMGKFVLNGGHFKNPKWRSCRYFRNHRHLFSLMVFFISFLFPLLYLVTCLHFYSFQVYFKFSMQNNTNWISNFAFASCVCLRIHYITVYFPFACCICLRICFISFCPRTIWDKYDGLGSSSVVMSRVPASTIISGFCKMQD